MNNDLARKEDVQKVADRVEDLSEYMNYLLGNMKTLETTVTVVKSDVQNLQSDVEILKSNVQDLQSDVNILKEDNKVLKADIKNLEIKIDETKNNMNRHFEDQMFVLETDLGRKLDIIIDKLDDNDRKINDINKEDKLQNNILDNHEIRILKLEMDN